MAHSGAVGRAPVLASAHFTDSRELLDLDLETLASGDLTWANPEPGPIYLVLALLDDAACRTRAPGCGNATARASASCSAFASSTSAV